ncbi:MAG: PfkB family carbohydrate kinase [Oscillospiraceae bacterium]|nr:PfkB family carbohydrate kinase [Oscillospiraceae bacterium]
MKKILALSCCCVDVFPEKKIVKVGGNALNLAVSCAATGKAEVYLMGYIGNDAYADKIKQTADEYKINRAHLYSVNGETANNKVYLTKDGDRYFKEDSWTNGVIRDFIISPADEILIQNADAVATTVNDGLISRIIEAKPKLFSVDFMEHTPNDDWRRYFSSLDLFFISGRDEYRPMLKRWSVEFPTLFVATLGEKGSVAYRDGKEYFCAAVDVNEVVDTTGCGDSYQGAFIVDYLHNGNIPSAMKAGATAAAVTLSFMGAVQERG